MFSFGKKKSNSVASSSMYTDSTYKPEKRSEKHRNVQPSSTGSNTLGALEPFQEVIDEAINLDWNELQGGDFSMADVSIDKPAATQAVAFVIRASRRGVVPLCAEVATLLREKTDLETAVQEQKEEISKLQSSVTTLRASMAKPPPITRDFQLQTVQEFETQTKRCSDAEVQTDNYTIPCIKDLVYKAHDNFEENIYDMFNNNNNSGAKKKENNVSPPGVNTACGAKVKMTCSCPALSHTSTQHPTMISTGVNTVREDCMDSALGYFEHKSLEKSHGQLENDKKRLTENLEHLKSSTEKSGSDLEKAKEEILSLQKAIQELQSKEYERIKKEEQLRLEETYSLDVHQWSSSVKDSDERVQNNQDKSVNQLLPMIAGNNAVVKPPKSSLFPGPILGCKCNMCTAFFRSSGILGFACTPYVTDSSGKSPLMRDLRRLVWLQNSKLQIQPNDQVIVRRNKLATVRYVGHLDSVGSPSIVYVGLELEEQGGRHDGYFHGKRYYFCPPKHGMFIPIQDIICVINKKRSPPLAELPMRTKTAPGAMMRNKKKFRRKSANKPSTKTFTKQSTSSTSSENSFSLSSSSETLT